MIDIVYIKNTEPLPQQADFIYHFIPESEKKKALAYRRWQDRQSFLLGKILLASLLRKNSISLQVLKTVQYNSFNRPFIPLQKLDFNISHSGDFVICSFSFNQVTGIDIEKVQPIDINDFQNILNDADRQVILTSNDQFAAFFRIWSAKEAILKAHGCGLVEDIFKLEVYKETGVFNNTLYYLNDLFIHQEYAACIASRAPITKVQIAEASFTELANFLF